LGSEGIEGDFKQKSYQYPKTTGLVIVQNRVNVMKQHINSKVVNISSDYWGQKLQSDAPFWFTQVDCLLNGQIETNLVDECEIYWKTVKNSH